MKHYVIILILVNSLSYSIGFSQGFEWVNTTGGNSSDYTVASVPIDNGDTYSVSTFKGLVEIDLLQSTLELNAGGESDILLSRISVSGERLWAKQINGSDITHPSTLDTDDNANLYFSGTFNGLVDFDPDTSSVVLSCSGGMDSFICKLDSLGIFQWVVQIGEHSTGNIGIGELAIGTSGSIYLCGGFTGEIDFDPSTSVHDLISDSNNDAVIAKYDLNGELIWVKQIGSTAGDLFGDTGFSLALDENENIFIAGQFQGTVDFDPGPSSFNLSSAGDRDAFALKLDLNGEFEWATKIGGAQVDVAHGIALGNFGSIYFCGQFSGSADFDPTTGENIQTSNGLEDAFVVKLDAAGSVEWTKVWGGALSDVNFSMTLDEFDNAYITGHFGGTVDFNPNGLPLTHTTTATGVFVCKITSNGEVENVQYFDAGGGIGYHITNDGQFLYTSGGFSTNCLFDLSPNSGPVESTGGYDGFLLKQNLSSQTSIVEPLESSFSVFPSPCIGALKIKLSQASDFVVNIWNSQGLQILKKDFGKREIASIHIEEPPGIYLVEIVTPNGIHHSKRIIKI